MEKQNEFPAHSAARDGKVDLLEALIRETPRLARQEDADGRLPLHWAASANCKPAILFLSKLPSFDPDAPDGSGWSALMIAGSRADGEEVVDLLLKLGADVNLKANGGQTLLHFVASKGNIEIARKLLNHTPAASTRVRDKQGQYPIHRAAAAGWTPMARLLLQHKSPLDATDISGFTALHHAVAEGHGDTAVALLQAGAEVGKRNIDGNLAIDIAPDAEVQKYIKRAAELEGIQL